jgi:soluble lytic murein transglycosylase-like protein
MAMSAATECTVTLLTPNGRRLTFASAQAADRALLAVETRKSLGEAVGSFSLHFVATTAKDGRRWHERIPKRTLVRIEMRRRGHPTLPDVTPTVMLGFTDDHAAEDSWGEAAPRRLVHVHGRELSALLLDATLWYHPGLAGNPAIGTLTTDSQGQGLQQMALFHHPDLARGGEDPKATLSRILDYFLYVGGSTLPTASLEGGQKLPVIQPELPEGLTLSQVLQKNEATWNTFEPVTVPMAQFPIEVSSVWNYLHLYIDRNFQEFFSRVEDGVCKLFFRGKPFLHTPVTQGTRFKAIGEEPTLRTLTLEDGDLIAQSTQAQTHNVYNVFMVNPLNLSHLFKSPNLRYNILPSIITDPQHPSFVGRYGLRVMDVESPYLSPLEAPRPGGGTPSIPIDGTPAGEARWAPVANQIAAEEGIPARLRPHFVALIRWESNFNPNAEGPVLRSQEHAKGIAQWVAPYPDGVGLTDPFNPEEALRAAARYWQQMRALPYIGDDPDLLVAGYNAGPGAVQTHKGVPPFHETQDLVRKVQASAPNYYGLAGVDTDPEHQPPPFGTPTHSEKLADLTTIIGSAQRWAAILMAWYEMGGELFGGTLVLRGHPAWNVGHRLTARDPRGRWEAYIEGVEHRYDMRTGQYLTTLRYTRGWYLSAAIAAQLRVEGATTMTPVQGGPPPAAVAPIT